MARDIIVKITDMAYGGEGVARENGFVYFVRGALPGQTVTLENVKKKKNYAKAEVGKVLADDEGRVESPCPYFGDCGGCQWLTVPYEQQVEWKRRFVADALTRLGGAINLEYIEITPSQKNLAYRQRLRMKLLVSVDGQMTMGFYRQGTHWVIPIHRCAIADERVNEAVDLIQGLIFPAGQAFHCSLEIQRCQPNSAELAVTVFLTDKVPVETRRDLLEKLRSKGISRVRFSLDESAEFYRYDHQFGVDYYTVPGAFQQVNYEGNRAVREQVRNWLTEVEPTDVLDLFCGSGNLSLGLGGGEVLVYGVEFGQDAIACANFAVEQNNLSGHTYVAGDASKVLAGLVAENRFFNLVIADPPRAGMPECIPHLLQMKPDHIFYLSCDPNTMARDIKRLQREHYKIKTVRAFDFFPNTFHVESLVWLARHPLL